MKYAKVISIQKDVADELDEIRCNATPFKLTYTQVVRMLLMAYNNQKKEKG